MILVLLGTFPVEFKRPLIEIEKLCSTGKLCEEIVIQNGHTKYSSTYLTLHPFMDPTTLDQLYDRARLIITHAGTGSIIKGLKKGKRVIAIPRLLKNGEHVDDHQLEIVQEFATSGYLIPWYESDSLEELLQKAECFLPIVYCSQKDKILNYLKEYIEQL